MTWEPGRRTPIPAATRKRILKRDHYRCYVCGQAGANEVDHVIPAHLGGPDTDDNLKAIHAKPCHLRKTLAEAQAAQQRPPRKRPTEAHPGVI